MFYRRRGVGLTIKYDSSEVNGYDHKTGRLYIQGPQRFESVNRETQRLSLQGTTSVSLSSKSILLIEKRTIEGR